MISYLKGIVAYKGSDFALLEVSGMGYELAMSTKALEALPPVGASAQILTYLQVKEDSLSLFGFSDASERSLFENLINVSGIGPKIALSALCTFSSHELSSAIAQGDVAAISSIPGIGKKTAQRLVLELQGVLKQEEASQEGAYSSAEFADAATALESMGFSPSEISSALKGCAYDDVSSIVRYALKALGGH